MTVTFCGHRDVSEPETIRAWLSETVEGLIREGADRFYLGGYGRFDALAAAVVREQKERHPEIRSVLVLPYLDREYDVDLYDESLYPPLESTPKRFAISKRNEYMINAADCVIAYVVHDFGGSYNSLCYAQRKNKRVIRYKQDFALPPANACSHY